MQPPVVLESIKTECQPPVVLESITTECQPPVHWKLGLVMPVFILKSTSWNGSCIVSVRKHLKSKLIHRLSGEL